MKLLSSLNLLVILCVVMGIASGCAKKEEWSPAEKESAAHFTSSIKSVMAVYAMNKGKYVDVPKPQRDQMQALYESAYKDAQAVSDPVLRRINPELILYYRQYFQNGLYARIAYWHNFNMDEEIKAQDFMAKWETWFGKNLHTFRLPSKEE